MRQPNRLIQLIHKVPKRRRRAAMLHNRAAMLQNQLIIR